MCGIGGIVQVSAERPVDDALLRRINELQRHRGPDEEGVFNRDGVGLAHTRLSIIDLAEGQQPMLNDDRSVVIVFNGEIYNFRQVRADLERLGHRFKTHSDTETILRAWEEDGPACVERLRGMFAFAIWDGRRNTLFLARDRVGIKPLYYGRAPDGALLFGSELKALLAYPGLPRTLADDAVEDYFALGYVPEPKTIYRGLFKLPPGHTLTWVRGAGEPRVDQYWDVPTAHESPLDAAAAQRLLSEKLMEAIELRLIAEVPLGAFLSGGVDSSAVVAGMSEIMRDPVVTCSIGFDEQAYDESEYAALVARRCGTDHTRRVVNPDDFDLVDKLATLYDEPYADSSAMPTYRVCQLARERVTVALSGDGGDELLAGYRRYRLHLAEERLRRRLPLGARRAFFGPLGRWYPKADWAPQFLRAKTTFQALARSSVEAYFHSVSVCPDDQRARLYSGDFKHALGGYRALEVFRAHARQCASTDPLKLVQYLDFKTYLVGDILTKVDRASMAHALEVRVPMLDHKFVEAMMALPSHLKIVGREGKWILKQALAAKLPHEVLYRRKMGFSVPLAAWFRGPLAGRLRDAVLGERMRTSGLFDQRYLETMIKQHQSGLRDFSASLWTLLMFESFLARHGSG